MNAILLYYLASETQLRPPGLADLLLMDSPATIFSIAELDFDYAKIRLQCTVRQLDRFSKRVLPEREAAVKAFIIGCRSYWEDRIKDHSRPMFAGEINMDWDVGKLDIVQAYFGNRGWVTSWAIMFLHRSGAADAVAFTLDPEHFKTKIDPGSFNVGHSAELPIHSSGIDYYKVLIDNLKFARWTKWNRDRSAEERSEDEP